jgi:hypothetical protein
MATYGSFPGVKVTTRGGGIAGVQVGAEEKLVIFGEGDTANATASVNEPTQIGARGEADTKFGEDSELATAMKDALANGANINYLYGVMLETSAVTAEAFGGTDSGTLANAPIVEDLSTITVSDTTDGTSSSDADFALEFTYESPPTQPSLEGSETDSVVINPLSGEWAADSSSDYEFDYEYQEWGNGFDAADTVLEEGETGIYAALSDAESVASNLSGKVTTLRGQYQMVMGVSGAQPNINSSESPPDAQYDPATYSDAIDDDSYFLVAPARTQDSEKTIVAGVAGLMAGHAIDNPIYNDVLSGFLDLEQKLLKAEADDFRDEQVIPIRQQGSIRVKDNRSTSSATDWERDFWRRRIVDRVILLAKQVGDSTIGRINDERTRNIAETQLFSEIAELVNDRLLKPNDGSETNWFVDVYEDSTNSDQVNIDVGITPYGIAKRIDESITINT